MTTPLPGEVLYRRDQRKAVELVITTQFASAAMLRRQLEIPYSRAQRILEDLEEHGFVGPLDVDSGRARSVLLPFAGMPDLRTKIDASFPALSISGPPAARCRDCSDLNLTPCPGRCS